MDKNIVIRECFDQDFKGLVMQDYKDLCGRVTLRTNEEVKNLLLMRSIPGHANEGHCLFEKNGIVNKYPEATNEDIVEALGLDSDLIKAKSQSYIYEVIEFRDRILAGEDVKHYHNTKGKPLFRITLFQNLEIQNLSSILIGMYLGSKMDNYDWRQKVEEKTNLKIGGGECIGVNREKIKSKNITLQDLATKEHTEEEKEDMIKENLLCYNVFSSKEVVQAYIRHAKGYGTSDDLAILLAGKLYGIDAAWGVFLTDAIDTWDKYTPFIHKNGQDEQLGYEIEKNKDLTLKPGKVFPSEEDMLKFISLIAKDNYKKVNADNSVSIDMKSESQRYFLQVNTMLNMSSIESHMKFLQGGKPAKMNLGDTFHRITNNHMYHLFQKKFNEVYCK
ncbi:MAG: hypothetical protein KKB39_04935 [Nanoarchaeota archaeon]|nr:hypothetical protein [Nanoarchaeota archaeon]